MGGSIPSDRPATVGGTGEQDSQGEVDRLVPSLHQTSAQSLFLADEVTARRVLGMPRYTTLSQHMLNLRYVTVRRR